MGLRREYRPSAWIKIGLLVLLLVVVVWATSCDKREGTSKDKQDWRPQQEVATMERLFEVALAPVGKTMYVWGGGWNPGDAKAGATAMQIGMPKKWAEFASEQTSDYNFEDYLEQNLHQESQKEYSVNGRWKGDIPQELGLDCSGYVGWVLYNVFYNTDGKVGYVSQSTGMAERLAEKGWGTLIRNPLEFFPGDIVSMQGHVWICLGTCEDGSVLLVHSSPPGVSVCGTMSSTKALDGNGNSNSIAVQLATSYMTQYHPEWQEKYPNRTVLTAYLEDVTILRWSSETLRNAETYQEKTGEEIMALLNGL